MPRALLSFILALIGSILPAQEQPAASTVRSIQVRAISTSREGLRPIDFGAIAEAWKRADVNLAVEKRFHVPAIEQAKGVIRELYRSAGRPVRVDHRVTSLHPHQLEVAFEVIELCPE